MIMVIKKRKCNAPPLLYYYYYYYFLVQACYAKALKQRVRFEKLRQQNVDEKGSIFVKL